MKLLIVCTDRGTHPPRRLGWLLPELTDGRRIIVLIPWAADLQSADRAEQRDTLRPPPCPTCRRTVPMRQNTAAQVYDTLTSAGITQFDQSRT